MNRKAALDIIRAEYAEHGEMTVTAARAYADSRIGLGTFTDAKKAGMRIYLEGRKR